MKKQTEQHMCNPSELRTVMSHLQREGTYFIAGANSIFVPKGKQRYTDKTVCKPWPDINGDIRQHTPGEAARVELKRQWPGLKRVGWSGKQVVLLDWRSPIFYTGPRVGRMLYLDLDGAYNQIYQRLWLDTLYPRGLYGQYHLAEVGSKLKIWKSARNCLIGITRSRSAVAYRGTKRIDLKIKNPYLSPGLWASVQTILHWIMNKAIAYGAIYGNVDGYIFMESDTVFVDNFMFWLSEQGLKWSIRAQGEGDVVCWNNYRIGSHATKSNQLNLKQRSEAFNYVNTTNDRQWSTYWRNCGKISEAR